MTQSASKQDFEILSFRNSETSKNETSLEFLDTSKLLCYESFETPSNKISDTVNNEEQLEEMEHNQFLIDSDNESSNVKVSDEECSSKSIK